MYYAVVSNTSTMENGMRMLISLHVIPKLSEQFLLLTLLKRLMINKKSFLLMMSHFR